MKTSISGGKHGIQWIAWNQPKDLDFVDDPAILSLTHEQICLRKIFNLRWSDTLSNNLLWQRTNQLPSKEEIMNRRWRWIEHILQILSNYIMRKAITWNHLEKKGGRPRNTLGWELEADIKRMNSGQEQL
ncbi:unnamed protein product [Schistosoma margrebowiei]|uniref:Uncharacterized protein n=1 Tax=Schistosoma margrebowiei TaxID=48269 RepID=A0A183MEA1_9TREM|nr:unnamed protein product [Schistosoma margrebowiei]